MTADRDDYPSPKQLLDARGLRARKRFGQNFLVDPRFARRVADAVPPDAFVVEIGAGTGSLTAALAARARAVVAFEIDDDLVEIVRERFAGETAVTIAAGDVLDADLAGLLRPERPARAVCGNLPYYITTPIIEKIIGAIGAWESAVLMVQREYAKRLTAAPGTADYASLTLYVGYHCVVEKLFDVGAAGFYPAPTVASAVIRLVPRPDRSHGVADERLLLRTIRAAFAQRRKTLANCLVARAKPAVSAASDDVRASIARALNDAGLDAGIRGERLSLDDFKRLANALSATGVDIV